MLSRPRPYELDVPYLAKRPRSYLDKASAQALYSKRSPSGPARGHQQGRLRTPGGFGRGSFLLGSSATPTRTAPADVLGQFGDRTDKAVLRQIGVSIGTKLTRRIATSVALGTLLVRQEREDCPSRGRRSAVTRVRYIGSKARTVDQLVDLIGRPEEAGFFVDAFSGTGVVGAKASEFGWRVRFNDHLLSAVIVSAARLLGHDAVPFDRLGGYAGAVRRLNSVPPRRGFIWREYSPASIRNGADVERTYFTEDNAAKLDAARATIEEWAVEALVNEDEKLLLIADVLSAANAVANIAGTYGCFMRNWLDGALKPVVFNARRLGQKSASFEVYNVDVVDVPIGQSDVAYFDPPYTKRQYAAYYHILETIAHGDEPTVGGVTGLRPWQDKASDFCYKKRALSAISSLLEKTPARRIYLSYSSEGHVDRRELEHALGALGDVTFHEIGHIGRYRPNQVATETASHVSEFLVELEKATLAEAAAA
jgi:adenine-specific DNA-methyltransferase